MQSTVENELSKMHESGNSDPQKAEAINRLAGSAHQVVDRIADGADTALRTLRGSSHDWKASGEESLAQVQAYVREKPLMALGMAVAAGFLLSRFMR